MKICMFTNTYTPHVGGVAKSVAAFTEDLLSKNHPVMVVAPRFDGQDDDETDNLIRVPAIQNFNGSDFSVPIPIPYYLEHRLREFDPDIFHSHHPFLLGDSALRAARKLDKPLIFTHHTRYEEYTHYVSTESENMRLFVKNLSKEYGNMCDAVIAPSESIKSLLVQQGVNSALEVIPTGTDLSFFKNADPEALRRKHEIDSNKKIIGHVGRLAPEKNLDYLIKAIVFVLKKQRDCIFLVTGEGVMRRKIEEIFEAEGLKDQLIMTGQLEGKHLAESYASMDLFIFTSFSETQGMVLVEAMAAGTPVIALDAPGAREVLKNGENGELLSAGTEPEEFAQTVMEYITDEKKIEESKAGALETAKRFSREASVAMLIDLYERVIDITRIKRTRPAGDLDPWEKILTDIKSEWELITQKTRAVKEIFQS